MAGHSLGEYTALVCAEAIAFVDAIRSSPIAAVSCKPRYRPDRVAWRRFSGSRTMRYARYVNRRRKGKCLKRSTPNSPGQVVIAGTAAAVARGVEQAKAAGAKRALMLPVSVPSHCRLMRPAAEQLAQRLTGVAITAPNVPVLHNAHVQSESTPDGIRAALVRQLASPVRWTDTIRKMAATGSAINW